MYVRARPAGRTLGICSRAYNAYFFDAPARSLLWRWRYLCARSRGRARTVLVIKRLVTDLKLTMVNAELYRAALITRLGSVRLGERLIFSGRWRATAKARVKELDLLQVQQRGGGSRVTAVLVKGGTQ